MLKFISDIGSNHNQDLGRCLEFVKISKAIGCYGVKFQLFRPELLYSEEFPEKIEKMKNWALPPDFIFEIRKECRRRKIKFICTPFDLPSLSLLVNYVDFLKIGSYELLYGDLITSVIRSGLPWLFSTGMTQSVCEILPILRLGEKYKSAPWAILHCNSNYPAKPENCNLFRIQTIRCLAESKIHVGWSDHTKDKRVILAAIDQGATVFEFHLDLEDEKGVESSFGHCWTPSEAEDMIMDAKKFSIIHLKGYGENSWICSETKEEDARKWRTDPSDGKRPLKIFRKELSEKQV